VAGTGGIEPPNAGIKNLAALLIGKGDFATAQENTFHKIKGLEHKYRPALGSLASRTTRKYFEEASLPKSLFGRTSLGHVDKLRTHNLAAMM
jgi:hypothetical protein